MNPQQFYQYHLAGISPSIQSANNQISAPYLAAGNISMIPPPPPPNFFAKCIDPPQLKVGKTFLETSSNVKNIDDGISQETSNAESPVTTKSEVIKSEDPHITVSDSAATSSIAPPSSVNSPQFVGGVYAGAYIQQAMPQVSASAAAAPPISSAQTQYVLASGVSPFSVSQTPKLMYLPPTIPHGATSGSYYIPPAGGAHPAVVVDQAGKPTVLGTSMQMPMQYQIASAGLKPALPQQYVLTSPYYHPIQAYPNPAIQPVYSPVQGVLPAMQNGAALSTLGGITPPGPSSQVYYYQY